MAKKHASRKREKRKAHLTPTPGREVLSPLLSSLPGEEKLFLKPSR
jgi:hypothetical protein